MIKQFEIVKKLGEGSYSTVYEVLRKRDQKIYAMKKVNFGFLSEKEIENALNEVRIMASVRHPNVVAYKECFYDSEQKVLCVIMEHADGGDLLQKIKKHRQNRAHIPEWEIWNIFIQVTQGLKAIHESQIVHRDLKDFKSANILIQNDGRVKLADFNVSKIVKNSMTQTQIGTPFYASPEIWNYIPYDYKADVWSLGCILYEMCQLTTPFHSKDMQSICKKVCTGVYKSIPSIYSNDITILIDQMLNMDPQDRSDCRTIISSPQVQAKIRQANNQSLFFNGHNDTSELLSTIEWNPDRDILDSRESRQRRVVVPKKKRFINNLSVNLPPADYTPKMKLKTIDDEKQACPMFYSIHHRLPQEILTRVNSQRQNPNSRSMEQQSGNKNSINQEPRQSYRHVTGNIMEENQINEVKSDEPKKVTKRFQLKPLVNLSSIANDNNVVADKSLKPNMRQEFLNKYRDNRYADQLKSNVMSRNSDRDIRENKIQRQARWKSINTDQVDQKQQVGSIYNSVERPREITKFSYRKNTIIEETIESIDEPKNKNKMQIKQIIDLLQGNPLKRNPSKLQSENNVNSNKAYKELIDQNQRQNVQDMQNIQNQMQDISRIIHQTISHKNNRKK